MPLAPVFMSYVLSFTLLGTYWNNHHHLLQASTVVDGRTLWANLVPAFFAVARARSRTAWMGETAFAPVPTAVYGLVSLLAALSFLVLVRCLVANPGQTPTLAEAIGRDRKGLLSPLLYAIAIPFALVAPVIALALFVTVVSDLADPRPADRAAAREPWFVDARGSGRLTTSRERRVAPSSAAPGARAQPGVMPTTMSRSSGCLSR